MDNQASIQARFGVMVNGRVAEVKTAAVHAVVALDEVHEHLVNARVVAVPPPSERWYRLLDEFGCKATAPEFAHAGSLVDVGEHADRFARDLFVAAAAFLAAEANDLEDRVSLLAGDRRQEETRARLDEIADKVGDVADTLIGRVEDGTWQKFSENIPRIRADALPTAGRLPGGLGSSQLDEARQPTRSRIMQMVGRTAWPAAAGIGVSVVIILFSENLWYNALQSYLMIVVAVLPFFFGLLLGLGLHTRGIDQKYRSLARRTRLLNELAQHLCERDVTIARREEDHPAAIYESRSSEIPWDAAQWLSEQPLNGLSGPERGASDRGPQAHFLRRKATHEVESVPSPRHRPRP